MKRLQTTKNIFWSIALSIEELQAFVCLAIKLSAKRFLTNTTFNPRDCRAQFGDDQDLSTPRTNNGQGERSINTFTWLYLVKLVHKSVGDFHHSITFDFAKLNYNAILRRGYERSMSSLFWNNNNNNNGSHYVPQKYLWNESPLSMIHPRTAKSVVIIITTEVCGEISTSNNVYLWPQKNHRKSKFPALCTLCSAADWYRDTRSSGERESPLCIND